MQGLTDEEAFQWRKKTRGKGKEGVVGWQGYAWMRFMTDGASAARYLHERIRDPFNFLKLESG